jgi:hypothetical protein
MGVWGSPQTVSGSAQGAAGTVAARFFLENGEQKHDGAVERGEREIGQKSRLTRLAEE